MSHPPPSRDRMLEAAIRLLRTSGLSGAGINEIVRESGAPKGSVYHHFPDGKTQIAAEALALYASRVLSFLDTALAAGRTPTAKVRSLFGAMARRVESTAFAQSCAIGTVTLDLEPDMELLRGVLVSSLAEWQALVASHFDLGDARRTRSFAGLLLTAIEGAYIRCRAERSAAPFVEAGKWLTELVADGDSRRSPRRLSA
jgi:TetR/AcrR family transcriptional repressor of lmrAB and yxaGH operons